MGKKFQPIIKWSGSKRSQCDEILSYFPRQINTYYEPFCGGCSMLMGLILHPEITVKKFVCSDLNRDLINLWNMIKKYPLSIFETYVSLWTELNKDDDLERKKNFFNQQRELYNKNHSPAIFFFIMRTTTNGMPRYNKNGEFNNSFHVTRNGIKPTLLKPILMKWSELLNRYNVEFRYCSYEDILPKVKAGDFIYMDPPYYNTKGMYFGGFDFDTFFSNLDYLCKKRIKYALSFDGKSGSVDNTCDVLPKSCYKQHMYIKSGNSSFKRTIGKDTNAMVYESLYLNY